MAAFMIGGARHEAKSAEELVAILHAESLTPAADDKAWMEDVSQRLQLQSGVHVRTGSAMQFVNDLIACGRIKPC